MRAWACGMNQNYIHLTAEIVDSHLWIRDMPLQSLFVQRNHIFWMSSSHALWEQVWSCTHMYATTFTQFDKKKTAIYELGLWLDNEHATTGYQYSRNFKFALLAISIFQTLPTLFLLTYISVVQRPMKAYGLKCPSFFNRVFATCINIIRNYL